ncbi:FAD-dependent oxidoreductase [Proteinivorax tanatarense]|uniref:FAD-dependent oxidoreductase n=1 Tax=Proteinivorax tanatarense TaxID=1260629 RepID=A0AAU7VPA2_9FIRM
MGGLLMSKVVVIGGGWAGCAAAISARKLGAEVKLLERTDMLLGTGLVGGIMRNNGRFTATEEMIAMGATELFEVCDLNSLHTDIEFFGHKHASFYNVSVVEGKVRSLLHKMGIKTIFNMRGKAVTKRGNKIISVSLDDGTEINGDTYVDATGTAGPMNNCKTLGNGCVMCIYRCPTFGGRISISEKAGVSEYFTQREDGTNGAFSGSCKIVKESLAVDIQEKLEQAGLCIIPVTPELQKENVLSMKACQQYARKEYQENIVLINCGHAKMMSPYYPLSVLRMVPGFESARYADPLAGGVGNSIRLSQIAEIEPTMLAKGVENLFCAGEKAGPFVGHTEAIVTGTLAGFNGVKLSEKEKLLTFPTSLAVGEGISYTLNEGKSEGKKCTFSGSSLFENLQEKNLYTTEKDKIVQRVKKEKLDNVFNHKIMMT